MVDNPGEYPLEKDITVLQGIVAAGGFTERAMKEDVVIVQRGPTGQVCIEFDYNRVVSGKEMR